MLHLPALPRTSAAFMPKTARTRLYSRVENSFSGHPPLDGRRPRFAKLTTDPGPSTKTSEAVMSKMNSRLAGLRYIGERRAVILRRRHVAQELTALEDSEQPDVLRRQRLGRPLFPVDQHQCCTDLRASRTHRIHGFQDRAAGGRHIVDRQHARAGERLARRKPLDHVHRAVTLGLLADEEGFYRFPLRFAD